MDELKRTMKLIWGSKRYRKAFGANWTVYGFLMIVSVIFGAFPMINEWVGEETGIAEYVVCSIFPAIMYAYMCAYLGSPFAAMFGSGKSLVSFPGAKSALTKGILMNRGIMFGCVAFPAILMRGISALLGFCEVSLLDDMLLAFGVAFVFVALMGGSAFAWLLFVLLFAMIPLLNIFGKRLEMGFIKAWAQRAYDYVMPWWLVVLIVAALLVGGTWLGMVVLERAYKKRKVVLLLEQRVAER